MVVLIEILELIYIWSVLFCFQMLELYDNIKIEFDCRKIKCDMRRREGKA